MNVAGILNAARLNCDPPNYSGLAYELGVKPSAVSNWRNGRALPDEVSCGKLADLAGFPLAQVLGIVGEQRALSKDAKAVWKRLASAAGVIGRLPIMSSGRAWLRRVITPLARLLPASSEIPQGA